MIQQVIAEFLKMKVIKPLMNALFSAVGLPTIPMDTSAGGGTIQGGRPTLVGERGPEIFVPNTGGTIMNNMNSRNAMGGGTPINIYQNLNFATGVVPTVRAEITKMMPQIADVTKAAVQESAMRGGSFRRSLVGG
jgi:phage-related minor tail protein